MAAIHRSNSGMNSPATPSSFRLQHSSPLDTLVRSTSSRRVANAGRSTRQAEEQQQQHQEIYVPPAPPVAQYYQEEQRPYSTDSDSYPGDYIYEEYTVDEVSALDNLSSTPQKPNHLRKPPSSPLLHTQFRNSSATTDDASFIGDPQSRSSVATTALLSGRSFDANGAERQYQTNSAFYDDDSVYSRDSSAWPQPPNGGQFIAEDDYRSHMGEYRDSWKEQDENNVPTVVVSSYQESRTPVSSAGRQTANYSRPVRPSEPSTSSLPLLASDQRKLDVLQRNASRRGSPLNSPALSSNQTLPLPPPSPSPSPSPALYPQQSYFDPVGPAPAPKRATPGRQPPPSTDGSSTSPASPIVPYSTYSFYQLDSAGPSPTGQSFLSPNSPHTPTQQQPKQPPSTPSYDPLTDPRTVNDYLQLGIKHHEANRLRESAACFEKSAKGIGPNGRPAPPPPPKSSSRSAVSVVDEDTAGCGVGMLMWGLTLRHGWGCEKNEKMGFKWLTKAAESAVGDLEGARSGLDANAVKTELVLAIYEVGQCFFQGWGVAKDRQMAVSYYQVAARLGDPDAQHDLAFCLANGKGCKKDKKTAAKWYRAAVAQGASDIGLAWINKEKYT